MDNNILVLDTGNEWGGGTNSLIELLKRIDRTKYNFSAIFYKNYSMGVDSDIKKELDKLNVEFILLERGRRSLLAKALKEVGRTLFFFSKRLRKGFIFYVDYMSRILPDSRKIASVLKERQADLLYMNNQPSSNLEGILAAKAFGIPCIQHVRIDVNLNFFEVKALNKTVSKIICVSKGVMDTIVRNGVDVDKCTVVYNGIDSGLSPQKSASEIRRELGLSKDSFLIGTVGSLIRRKRAHLLLSAVACIKKMAEKPIVCLIVGDGPEMRKLLRKVKELNIQDWVFFVGFKTNAITYINAMDIFVLPSEKEGLPRVILEAMLMAKPVVAFDIGGPVELVVNNKTGVLLKSEDGSFIAEAVIRLLRDENLMYNMGVFGRKRVLEEFSIERYVSGVMRVFEEIIH